MKKICICLLFTAIASANAQSNLSNVPDGPPSLLDNNAPVKSVNEQNTKTRSTKSSNNTNIEESRRRGHGIQTVKVKYKDMPSYELRKEIGERAGETEKSDLDTQTTVPQWKILSW